MQRDMDLVRTLLLEIEKLEAPVNTSEWEVEGIDHDALEYHAALLHEAGFILASDRAASRGQRHALLLFRLTWEGHEFLDSARNPTTWEKAKGVVQNAAGSVSVELLRKVLRWVGGEAIRATTGIDLGNV